MKNFIQTYGIPLVVYIVTYVASLLLYQDVLYQPDAPIWGILLLHNIVAVVAWSVIMAFLCVGRFIFQWATGREYS